MILVIVSELRIFKINLRECAFLASHLIRPLSKEVMLSIFRLFFLCPFMLFAFSAPVLQQPSSSSSPFTVPVANTVLVARTLSVLEPERIVESHPNMCCLACCSSDENELSRTITPAQVAIVLEQESSDEPVLGLRRIPSFSFELDRLGEETFLQ